MSVCLLLILYIPFACYIFSMLACNSIAIVYMFG